MASLHLMLGCRGICLWVSAFRGAPFSLLTRLDYFSTEESPETKAVCVSHLDRIGCGPKMCGSYPA